MSKRSKFTPEDDHCRKKHGRLPEGVHLLEDIQKREMSL